jgi:hypothetical protein
MRASKSAIAELSKRRSFILIVREELAYYRIELSNNSMTWRRFLA